MIEIARNALEVIKAYLCSDLVKFLPQLKLFIREGPWWGETTNKQGRCCHV